MQTVRNDIYYIYMEQIINFDPTIEKLQSIIAETSKITADDLTNDSQLAIVKGTRIRLRDARIIIEKQGKEMRASALQYQKDVIAREKELIGIIEPEEIRLKEIEESAKEKREHEARVALLPMRKEIVGKFGTFDDDFLLSMENEEFMVFLNQKTAERNEADRLEIEAEKNRLAREKELEDAKRKAAEDERNRIETLAKANEEARIAKAAQEKRDAEIAAQRLIEEAKIEAQKILDAEKARIAKIEAEKKEKLEKIKKESDEKEFRQWLSDIGYVDDGSWKIEHENDTIKVYKLVDVWKIKK